MNERTPVSRRQNIIITLIGVAAFVIIGATAIWPSIQPRIISSINSFNTKPTEITLIAVSDLLGRDFTNAQKIAASKGFKLSTSPGSNTCISITPNLPNYVGTKCIVTQQSPPPGTIVPNGTTITILLTPYQLHSP